jgi:ankyrin repeat protein
MLLKHELIHVNHKNKAGETALIYAARSGHAKTVEMLLKHKLYDVSENDKERSYALYQSLAFIKGMGQREQQAKSVLSNSLRGKLSESMVEHLANIDRQLISETREQMLDRIRNPLSSSFLMDTKSILSHVNDRLNTLFDSPRNKTLCGLLKDCLGSDYRNLFKEKAKASIKGLSLSLVQGEQQAKLDLIDILVKNIEQEGAENISMIREELNEHMSSDFLMALEQILRDSDKKFRNLFASQKNQPLYALLEDYLGNNCIALFKESLEVSIEQLDLREQQSRLALSTALVRLISEYGFQRVPVTQTQIEQGLSPHFRTRLAKMFGCHSDEAIDRAFASFFASSGSKDLVGFLEYCSGYDYRDLLKQAGHPTQSQLHKGLANILEKAQQASEGQGASNNSRCFFSDVSIVFNEDTLSTSINAAGLGKK